MKLSKESTNLKDAGLQFLSLTLGFRVQGLGFRV